MFSLTYSAKKMIEVDALSKHYGTLKAVDNISFQVEKGEILGFLGPNGAGKSTTMKVLSCFISPTSGTARIQGKDVGEESVAVRKLIGYLPENCPTYHNMTVFEFLDFIASIRGFGKREKRRAVEKIIETTSLDDVKRQTISTLSKGYRQRTEFAQALIHDPPVLILDEPTDGLDPNQKKEIRDLIKAMSGEKAIILSTHILEEMEAVCGRALIIDRGKIVGDGSPSELLAMSKTHNTATFTLKTRPSPAEVEALSAVDGAADVEVVKLADDNFKVRVFPKHKHDIFPAVKNFIAQSRLEAEEIYREKGLMNEVFWNLTLGERRQL